MIAIQLALICNGESFFYGMVAKLKVFVLLIIINIITMGKIVNIHPGEILEKEFLVPLGITAYKLSKAIGVQQTRISLIRKGERGITADTAMRFSKFFGTSPEFWMPLQREYDLRRVRFELKEIIDSIVPVSG